MLVQAVIFAVLSMFPTLEEQQCRTLKQQIQQKISANKSEIRRLNEQHWQLGLNHQALTTGWKFAPADEEGQAQIMALQIELEMLKVENEIRKLQKRNWQFGLSLEALTR